MRTKLKLAAVLTAVALAGGGAAACAGSPGGDTDGRRVNTVSGGYISEWQVTMKDGKSVTCLLTRNGGIDCNWP